MPAASTVGGLRLPSVHQLAVTACRYRCCIALFRALLVQVTAHTPHTTSRLLAVSSDMAELLAVVTLRETCLSFVRLCRDCNMTKAHQFQYLVDFDVLDKVMKKKGVFTVVVLSAGDQRVVDLCLTLIM
jgi:hypothetical protein